MYRIGLLLPSSNTVMEPELYQMAPKGVSIHSARMQLKDFTQKDLLRMVDDVSRETALLSNANVDVIIYGCSTCSLVGGVDWEKVLAQQIEFDSGKRVVTVNRAVVKAINRLGDGGVGVVTPYDPALNILEREYLESHGLDVVSCIGMGLHNPEDISNATEKEILAAVKIAVEYADILYLSCTNLPAVQLIDKIESEYDVPVVTGNQAALWSAIDDQDLDRVVGYGRLF